MTYKIDSFEVMKLVRDEFTDQCESLSAAIYERTAELVKQSTNDESEREDKIDEIHDYVDMLELYCLSDFSDHDSSSITEKLQEILEFFPKDKQLQKLCKSATEDMSAYFNMLEAISNIDE